MYNPEVQKQHVIKEIKEIRVEARSEVIRNYNTYVNARPINEETDIITNVVRWVKSARVFKKNTRKSGKYDIRFFC